MTETFWGRICELKKYNMHTHKYSQVPVMNKNLYKSQGPSSDTNHSSFKCEAKPFLCHLLS